MDVSRQRWLAMIVLVAMPLCVALITAVGLARLDTALAHVAEEYDELRELEEIDESVSNARLAMQSGEPAFVSEAKQKLEDASAAMVKYLASQSGGVSDLDHQAREAREAAAIIEQLHAINAVPIAHLPERIAEVDTVRQGLDVLRRYADVNVRTVQTVAHETRQRTLTWVVSAGIGCAALCMTFIAWANRKVNRRLMELHQRLAAQARGPVPETSRELGGVVSQIEELNTRMIEKIEESGRELLRRERLAAIGVLAADVAHEINNPMNAMLGLTELTLRTAERGPIGDESREELIESLRVVRREAVRCKAIVERFMAMARTDRKPAWFDAAGLVRETMQVAQAARPDRATCFVHTGDSLNVPAFAQPSEVRQILLTLMINAADAIAPEGRIEVDATRTDQEVWIRVRDNGKGLTEEARRSLFTPFHSFDESGRGLGLGLSIASTLAQSMNATLLAFSDGPGRGSTFVLAIPNLEQHP